MAARKFTRRARGAGTRDALSGPVARTRPRSSNARFLHVPAIAGQAKPIKGREAAMTLMQAVHVVAHAVLRGAFSIRWASPSRLSPRSRRGK
jgi:hypothetical protein